MKGSVTTIILLEGSSIRYIPPKAEISPNICVSQWISAKKLTKVSLSLPK